MNKHILGLNSMLVLALLLSSCGLVGGASTVAPTPLPPPQHVENALQWLQTHAMMQANVDWDAMRRDSAGTIARAATTKDTIPVICEALRQLQDGNAWLLIPGLVISGVDSGYQTDFPDFRTVTALESGGPAEKAGLHLGDVLVERNGEPIKPYDSRDLAPPCNTGPTDQNTVENLTVQRAGKTIQIAIHKTNQNSDSDPYRPVVGRPIGSGARQVGYLELVTDSGSHENYVSDTQHLIRKLDQLPVCGWAVDLRRNQGGDLWTYIAALGPILGEGDLGGFVYLDGTREPWTYQRGKVYWDRQYRDESMLRGAVYHPKQAKPVALLVSRSTQAAGELILVAFQGRPEVRSFGQPTRGLPTLVLNNTLSDGSRVFVSGANTYDRKGKLYSTSIQPDVPVANDWARFGTVQDPVLQAAAGWLQSQPACNP